MFYYINNVQRQKPSQRKWSEKKGPFIIAEELSRGWVSSDVSTYFFGLEPTPVTSFNKFTIYFQRQYQQSLLYVERGFSLLEISTFDTKVYTRTDGLKI